MSRFRNVCFTNFDCEKKYLDERIRYLIAQKEICPSTKKEHIQGYVEFDRALTFGQIKTILGNSTHIQRRNGNQQQAIRYCQKEESRAKPEYKIEIGAPSEQGARNDIHAMNDMALTGSPITDIVAEHPSSLRYVNNILRLQQFLDPPVRQVSEYVIAQDSEELGVYLVQNQGQIFHFHSGFESYNFQTRMIVWNRQSMMERRDRVSISLGHPMTLETRQGPRVCYITEIIYLISMEEYNRIDRCDQPSPENRSDTSSSWELPKSGVFSGISEPHCHIDGVPSVPKKRRMVEVEEM